jgi:hypothetical protein
MATESPIRPGVREDEETERLVRERLANKDKEPDEDAREALDDIARRNLKHPAPK